jgi:hypothetical protein
MVAASIVAARDKRTAQFEPFTLLPAGGLPVCLSAAIATPVLSHRAAFGRATFLRAMSELVLHPERTSAHVLRSEILDERSLLDDPRARLGPTEAGAAVDEHPTVVRFVRRRLLPNQPSLERPLEQEVTFGRSDTGVWVEMRSLVGRSADVSCGLPAVRVLRCAYLFGPRRESTLELTITPFVDTVVDHDSLLFDSCLDHLRTIVETATKQTQDDCRLPKVRDRFSVPAHQCRHTDGPGPTDVPRPAPDQGVVPRSSVSRASDQVWARRSARHSDRARQRDRVSQAEVRTFAGPARR